MTAITIQVFNEVVETFGVADIDRDGLVAQVALKIAAKEWLKDLKTINLAKGDP